MMALNRTCDRCKAHLGLVSPLQATEPPPRNVQLVRFLAHQGAPARDFEVCLPCAGKLQRFITSPLPEVGPPQEKIAPPR